VWGIFESVRIWVTVFGSYGIRSKMIGCVAYILRKGHLMIGRLNSWFGLLVGRLPVS